MAEATPRTARSPKVRVGDIVFVEGVTGPDGVDEPVPALVVRVYENGDLGVHPFNVNPNRVPADLVTRHEPWSK